MSLGFPQHCWALGKMRKARFIFRVITPARVIDGPNNKQGARAWWPSITLPRPWCHPGEGEASCAKETKVSLQFQQQTEIHEHIPKPWSGIAPRNPQRSKALAGFPWAVLGLWGLIWGLMRVNRCNKTPFSLMDKDSQGKIIARFARSEHTVLGCFCWSGRF